MLKASKSQLEFFEWIDALVFCAVTIILIFLFFFRLVTVQGISMEPTFYEGDRLIIRSIAYEPEHGDVVVLDSDTGLGKPLVKRVIAVGGDTIDIDPETGAVYVNGDVINEDYISAPTTQIYDTQFPLTVDDGHVIVLGDNRPNSQDSRSATIGQVDARGIMGEAIFRIWPLDRSGIIE